MAQPTVTIYINNGTEATPSWTEVGSTDTIYFTGPDTTTTTLDPVTAPAIGAKWAEELWEGTASTHTQATTFVAPDNATQNANVLRVYFANEPTSTPPELTAWDDNTHSTTAVEMLAGTTETSSTSFLKAAETTGAAPAQNWATYTTATSGGASINALKGTDNYIVCSSVASANTEKTFAIACVVPSDATSGTTGHTPVLTVRYTYT